MSDDDTANFTPKGWRTITPRIVARDSRSLVEFVKQVFEATGEYRDGAPTVLSIGDSMIMISDIEVRGPTSAFLYVYVCATPMRRIGLLSRQAQFQWRSRETYRTEIGAR